METYIVDMFCLLAGIVVELQQQLILFPPPNHWLHGTKTSLCELKVHGPNEKHQLLIIPINVHILIESASFD